MRLTLLSLTLIPCLLYAQSNLFDDGMRHFLALEYKQAAASFEQAAAQNHAEAHTMLAFMHLRGLTGDYRLEEAEHLSWKALELGDEKAGFVLGLIQRIKADDYKDIDEDASNDFNWQARHNFAAAIHPMHQAAETNPFWLTRLALCYEYEYGVEKDMNKVHDLLRKAVKQNYVLALHNLGVAFLHDAEILNYDSAYYCFEKATALGFDQSPDGMFEAAFYKLSGRYLAPDSVGAIAMLRNLHAINHTNGSLHLALATLNTEKEKAVKIINNLAARDSLHYRYGIAYLHLYEKNYEAALNGFHSINGFDNYALTPHWWLAQIYRQRNTSVYNPAKSLEHLQYALHEEVRLPALLPSLKPGTALGDFVLPDANGTYRWLSEYHAGNYLLIDFWASWCGPCRRVNPDLVKLHKKYGGKNFNILGISLDQNRDAWLRAIEKDGLPWPQLSDLKYWQSPAVAWFGFNAIPFKGISKNPTKLAENFAS